MLRLVTSTAAGLLLGATASTALGVGLGRGAHTSTLGQPLNFSVQVNADSEEVLTPECVAAEVFAGDVKLSSPSVRLTLEPGQNPTQATVRVVTSTAIEEPVVTVSVSVGCPQRVARRFVLFVDPPLLAFAPTVAPDSAPNASSPPSLSAALEGADTDTARATPPRSAAPSRRTPSRRTERTAQARSPAVARQHQSTGSPLASRQNRSLAAPRAAAKAVPSTGSSRLKLESERPVAKLPAPAASAAAAEAPAIVAANPAASAAEKGAGAASAPQQLDPSSERVIALEESLNRLNAEAKATRNSLETLQARLREADRARTSNPLVWLFGGLSAALALLVLALLRRHARARREAEWWNTAGGVQDPAAAAVPKADGNTRAGSIPTAPLTVDTAVLSAASAQRHARASVGPAPVAVTSPHMAVLPQRQAAQEPAQTPARELSVEELIDLEQQVDFFIVLGQDETAIELLMGHVRGTGSVGPMPYLKLLEIYRRQGDRSAYEQIRVRFQQHFNAQMPGFDGDPERGRTIEDYPELVAALLAVWPMPAKAAAQLNAWLTRGGVDGPSFELPAYAELIFLHVMARDLAERDLRPGGIDMRLPMALVDESPAFTLNSAMSFETLPSSAATTSDLDLDLSLPPAKVADHVGLSSGFISLQDDSRDQG